MFLFEKNFKGFAKKSLFYLIFLVCCLLPFIPFRVSFMPILFPSFAGMIVFNFYVLRKEVPSYFLLFLFAIIYDTANYSLLGSTVLVWLLAIKIMDFLRAKLLTSQDFVLILRDYALFNFLVLFFQWIIISFQHKFSYPLLSLLQQFILDIIIYILIYKSLKKLESFYNV